MGIISKNVKRLQKMQKQQMLPGFPSKIKSWDYQVLCSIVFCWLRGALECLGCPGASHRLHGDILNNFKAIRLHKSFWKTQISHMKSGTSGKNPDLGSRGLGVIFNVNIIKRLTQKLHRMILLHVGLVTFRIHFRETRKPFIVMVFGPSRRDHDSQNQYYWSLETPNDSK